MIKYIIPVSGGKDSQSCLKLASELLNKEEVIGLFCDTGWEHPLTYAHVDSLEKMYGINIVKIQAGTVEEKVLKYNRFPGFSIRFCTDELKMRPTRDFVKALAIEQNTGFEVWYGMRAGESPARAKRYKDKISEELYPPHEIFPKKYPKSLSKLGVMFKLPILDWTTKDVYSYLGEEKNPLYNQGFNRVGCFPCLAGSDASKRNSFDHDEFGKAQYKIVQILEEKIGKPVYQKDYNESGGCMICQI